MAAKKSKSAKPGAAGLRWLGDEKTKGKLETCKIWAIAVLLLGNCFLLYYFHAWLQVETVIAHLFYVPIILASLWWRRKGLIVAGLSSAMLIFIHVVSRPEAPITDDYCRAFMFLVSGFIVAELAESIAKQQKELARAKFAAEAANRAKGEFLANMSHEIRTPMTAIMGFADLLMVDDMPFDERREYLEIIRRNSENLLAIISDILDLSKIEAEKLTLKPMDCAPLQIVDEVLSLMKIRATEKKLVLNADYVFPLPKTIHTDPARLRQILVNLVGNAIKFTESGMVRITVRHTRGNGTPARMRFEVADTGIGMAAEEISEIFQPFTQADMSPSRWFGGTGLGLSISQRLAKLLGGQIEVQSEPGKGSTFTVTIDPGPLEGVPMLESPAAVPAKKEEKPVLASRARTLCGRVLLAEDGRDIQRSIGLLLQWSGLEVDLAENGSIACEKAAASEAEGKPYDLILMDIRMPVLDGYEATRRLRRNGWQGPIVALTAHAMVGDQEKCLQAGCNGYIPKPFRPMQLLDTLAQYLGQSASKGRPVADTSEPTPESSALLDSNFLSDTQKTELMEAFVTGLSKRIEQIERSLREEDMALMGETVHALKGAAAVFGFSNITDRAFQVEQLTETAADFEQLQAPTAELLDLCHQAANGKCGR